MGICLCYQTLSKPQKKNFIYHKILVYSMSEGINFESFFMPFFFYHIYFPDSLNLLNALRQKIFEIKHKNQYNVF